MVGGVDREFEEEEVVVHTRSITNTQTCYCEKQGKERQITATIKERTKT
jgi:hypothetical protein